MSDLIEFIVEVSLDLILEFFHARRRSKGMKVFSVLILFTLVTGLLVLSYLFRAEHSLFYFFSATGSLLGLYLLYLIRRYIKDFERNSVNKEV